VVPAVVPEALAHPVVARQGADPVQRHREVRVHEAAPADLLVPAHPVALARRPARAVPEHLAPLAPAVRAQVDPVDPADHRQPAYLLVLVDPVDLVVPAVSRRPTRRETSLASSCSRGSGSRTSSSHHGSRRATRALP
jgi:hypothetical protein